MKDLRIGDKVIVTERYNENAAEVGMFGELVDIDWVNNSPINNSPNGFVPYCVKIKLPNGGEYTSWCLDVKRLEPINIISHDGYLKHKFV